MFKFLLLVFGLLAYSSAQLIRPTQDDFYQIGPIVEDDETVQFELTKKNSAHQLPQVHVRIDKLNDYRVRVRVENAFSSAKRRFIPPIQLDLDRKSKPNVTSRLYDVNIVSSARQSLVQVNRRSTNKTVFSVDLGTMIYSENFIQVQTTLPSNQVYGKCTLVLFLQSQSLTLPIRRSGRKDGHPPAALR